METEHAEEITLEANPQTTWTEEYVHAAYPPLQTAARLGIQTFDDPTLKLLNRRCIMPQVIVPYTAPPSWLPKYQHRPYL